MKYRVKQAFIILDDNGDVIDWRETQEEADTAALDMEQDDEDKLSMEKMFEAVDN